MCTVTVYRNDTALQVTMNRDEARSRGPELSPQIQLGDRGIPWLAPLDSDTGGTWMGVNPHGLIACLLNRYQDYDTYVPTAETQSRGKIIPLLLQFQNVADAHAFLVGDEFHPDRYPPFTLLLLDSREGIQFGWNGADARTSESPDQPWHMITSSFVDPAQVLPWREQAFNHWRDEGEIHQHGLPTFHLYQPEGMASSAPLMSRDISCTRSITQVTLSPTSDTPLVRHGAVLEAELNWAQFEHTYAFLQSVNNAGVAHGH